MTTDPKDAEIARLRQQWDEHDAAWSERVAVLTEARHKAEADRELWREAKEKADVDVERAKAERDAAVERAAAREAWAAECLLENECLTAERDAALAQVATAITGNKSGTICRDCRGVGMIHCSDPFNCGGMQPYTVEELKSALSRRDAQMRAEGMRMAAGIARSIIDGRVYFNERARSDDEAFACAILAAAKKEASP